jgi:zinc transport system substrate-binding protein
MQRFLSILLSLALSSVLCAGCSPSAARKDGGAGKLSVVSTIFPGYDFTREVAGGQVELAMLLPPGAESHSFEPTPQDIIKIQNCDVFIYVGGDSDTWVDGILDSMDTSGMKIISMMDLVETVPEELWRAWRTTTATITAMKSIPMTFATAPCPIGREAGAP